MPVPFGKMIAGIFACPVPQLPAPARRGHSVAVVLVALGVGGWIFAFKMKSFLGLGTTSDLYMMIQIATSWLDGEIWRDHFYGNVLAIHTYLLSPVLAVLVHPFGAAGLFVFLGLAAAFSVIATVKILRLLAVPPWPALAFALAVTLMPLSAHVYHDTPYGFHLELLEPVLALWLAFFQITACLGFASVCQWVRVGA